MIECPSCQHREFVGTLFCSECGARLVHASTLPTMSISPDRIREVAAATETVCPKRTRIVHRRDAWAARD